MYDGSRPRWKVGAGDGPRKEGDAADLEAPGRGWRAGVGPLLPLGQRRSISVGTRSLTIFEGRGREPSGRYCAGLLTLGGGFIALSRDGCSSLIDGVARTGVGGRAAAGVWIGEGSGAGRGGIGREITVGRG